MAWYRTGGGGIPSSLKTGMDGVLNKKFSTSTTYAPDTWADTVNLMGKLPEKTVNGSIAHISDGADRVPMKNLICNIDATLDGVSSVEVVQTGANILDGEFETGWINNDGSIATTSERIVSKNYFSVVGGQSYYFMCDQNWRYCFYNENFATIDRANTYTAPRVLQAPANAKYLRVAAPVESIQYMCVNYPSTITTQQPYSTPTTHTASLGQTIHGGSVDVVTGAGKKTWKEQNASEFQLWQRHNQGYFYVITSYTGKAIGQTNVIGEDLTTVNTSALGNTDYCICGRASDGAIYVRLTGTETLEEFHEWIDNKKISFELETPTDFTIDPITPTPETALGVNNIYNNTGDTSVTYRRDIELALEEV